MPTVAWIWDVTKLSLSCLLVQNHSIQGTLFDPLSSINVACTQFNKAVIWSHIEVEHILSRDFQQIF